MATRFTSLGLTGGLTIAGVLAGAAITFTTLSGTSGVVTGTFEAGTLSGSTIRDTAGTFLVSDGNARATTFEATTVSGATLRDTAGTVSCSAGACTVTTLNATTVEGVTISGATLRNTAGTVSCDNNGLCTFTTLEATTVSGATFRTTAGGTIINSSGLVTTDTLTVKGTMTGAKLTATPTSGTSALVLYGGAKGSHVCYRDSDGAGWTFCSYLDGTATCQTDASSMCP